VTPGILEFFLPGDIETRTGGYGYDREIVAGLRNLGWTVNVHELDASFPLPTAAALQDAREGLAGLPDDSLVLLDGLAFGAMPGLAQAEALRLKLVALVHHPLALESGLEEHQRLALYHGEKRALAAVKAVVVTSRATAQALAEYEVAPELVTVIEPGTTPAPVAAGSGLRTLQLLCVASLSTRKGHDVLFAALLGLQEHAWHLTLVGGEPPGSQVMNRMLAQLESYGFADRVTFRGTGDDEIVAAEYARADVFVLPTRYEGYGMVVAEALARGLPVISTRTGAIPELVGANAGIVVPPHDINALGAALSRVFTEPDLLPRLKAGALAARDRLPRWPDSCERLSGLLKRIAAE
jgi:glycosyltransferase involved in cell wall biosynthesis